MVTNYATRRLVIQIAVTGTMAARIRASLNLMVKQATTITICHTEAKATVPRVAASDEKNSRSMSTNQKSLL